MRYVSGIMLSVLTTVLLFSFQFQGLTCAADKQDITGWEKDSVYNRLYRVDQYQKLEGAVAEIIDVVPMKGMAPGLGMVIIFKSGEKATVHFAPRWFAKFLTYGFKPGDSVKVKGCWAEIDGNKVFLASKVRNGEYFEMKFRRTSDGRPFWTLKPEEMIQEKLED
jgi:hypothetical protein